MNTPAPSPPESDPDAIQPSPEGPTLEEVDLADKTVERISYALREGMGAALPEILRSVLQAAGKEEKLTAHELADIMRNDVIMAERIFRTAHTMGFNAGGTQLGSIREAIQLIGFDRVRSMARNLITLSEKKKHSSFDRKRACVRTLVTALMAQKLAEATKICNGEIAFLSVVFREYGRIALSTHAAEDYEAAMERAKEVGETRAFVEIFGLSPVDLSRRLLDHAPLSPAILRSVQDCPSDILEQNMNLLEVRVLALCDTATRFTSLALDNNLKEEEYRESVQVFGEMAVDLVPNLEEHIEVALASVHQHLAGLRETYGDSIISAHTLQSVQSRLEREDPPPPEEKPKPPTPEELERMRLEEIEAMNLSHWEASLKELQELFAKGSSQLSNARRHLVNAFLIGFEAQECWLFIQQSECPDVFVLVAGEGNQVAGLRDHAKFNRQEVGVLSVCARLGDNVFVRDLKEPRIHKYLPPWFRLSIGMSSMMLFSVRDQQSPVGILLVGWKYPRTQPLGDVQLATARQMLAIYANQQRGRLD